MRACALQPILKSWVLRVLVSSYCLCKSSQTLNHNAPNPKSRIPILNPIPSLVAGVEAALLELETRSEKHTKMFKGFWAVL